MLAPRRIFLPFLFFCFAYPAHAIEAENSPSDDKLLGWSITPGFGARVVSLEVKRRADGYTGTLTNDGSFSDPLYLSFDIESPSWMLASSNWGLSVRSHAQTFKLSRQQVPSFTSTSGQDYADFGTGVRGYYSYISPVAFYRMGDASGDWRLGIGYGYWKTWFKGDIILAPDGAATAGMPRTGIDGSIKGNTGPMLFWQVRGRRMLFEISISDVAFSGSGNRYTLSELLMNIGYQIHF